MPEANFNKSLNLPSKGGVYVRLKDKGDKVKFLIAGTPHYETIHWVGDKQFELCGKYNSDEPTKATCQYCEDYARAIEEKDKETEKAIRPVTNFYYPILDLVTNKPSIFQFSAKSIHYTIKNYADEGLDVFDTVWVVERTNEQGPNYYKVLNMGKPKLTPENKEQLVLAKELKIKTGKSSDSVTDEVPMPDEPAVEGS